MRKRKQENRRRGGRDEEGEEVRSDLCRSKEAKRKKELRRRNQLEMKEGKGGGVKQEKLKRGEVKNMNKA